MSDCQSNNNSKSLISVQRIALKTQDYIAQKDYDGAEKYLFDCLDEARTNSDKKYEFSVYSNLLDFYHQIGNRENALISIDKAMDLIEEFNMSNSVPAGSFYVKCGKVFADFDMNKEAVSALSIAQNIYESSLNGRDRMLGDLYHKIANVLVNIGQYDEANDYYLGALNILSINENGQAQKALIYMNMADAYVMEAGTEKASDAVHRFLKLAKEMLDDEIVLRNSYYAKVCKQCASGFKKYNDIKYADELLRRAEELQSGVIK